MMSVSCFETCGALLRNWSNSWVAGPQELERDELHLRAVEMQFILIAEVLKRLEQVSPEIRLQVSNIRQIAGMRNTIVHDYDEVDTEIVHAAATLNLPVLKQQINAWAAELGMEAPPE